MLSPILLPRQSGAALVVAFLVVPTRFFPIALLPAQLLQHPPSHPRPPGTEPSAKFRRYTCYYRC